MRTTGLGCAAWGRPWWFERHWLHVVVTGNATFSWRHRSTSRQSFAQNSDGSCMRSQVAFVILWVAWEANRAPYIHCLTTGSQLQAYHCWLAFVSSWADIEVLRIIYFQTSNIFTSTAWLPLVANDAVIITFIRTWNTIIHSKYKNSTSPNTMISNKNRTWA